MDVPTNWHITMAKLSAFMAGAANIDIGARRQQRVRRDDGNAALPLRLGQPVEHNRRQPAR